MIAIFVASSVSDVPDLPGGLSNYTGHFLGYGILSALAVRGFARARWAEVNRGAGVRAVVLCAAYGATDEIHQVFVANRTPDVVDWAFDVTGALLAALAVLLLARVMKRWT